jgi:PEP-CTERM motif
MRNLGLAVGCMAVLGVTSTSWAAPGVIVSEDFEGYASTVEMNAVWAGFDGSLDPALGSDGLGGSAGQSAFHPGGPANEMLLASPVFPTANEWLKLSVDIFDDDTNTVPPTPGVNPDNKRITLGMRWFNGNPFNSIRENILELGMYNDTVPNAHHAYRAVIFNGAGGPTGNAQSWGGWDLGTTTVDRGDPPVPTEIQVNTFEGTGGAVWNRYSVIISPDTVTFEFDMGADGTVDGSDTFTDVITTANGFDRLRFGGPSDISSLGGGVHFDNIVLERIAPIVSLQGDLNGDGFVGIADLNIVLGAWNQTVPPGDPLADPTGDGFVGIDDLNQVLGNFNAGTPPAASAVPEPATLALLGLGGLAMLRRRH